MVGRSQRGGIVRSGPLLGLAKLTFLFSAYFVAVQLTYLMDRTSYGVYGVVAKIIAIPNMVILQTLLYSVSRPLAAQFDSGFPSYYKLRSGGLKLGAVLGGTVGLAFWVGAPMLGRFFSDESIVGPLRAVAPISLFYAFYGVNVGTLNASRRFGWQAALDIVMALTKAGCIVGAALAGLELAYIVGGFTLASLIAVLLSVAVLAIVRPGPSRDKSDSDSAAVGKLIRHAGVLVPFTLCTSGLLAMDVILLKLSADTDAARAMIGSYASAQNVALVPYSLLTAVNLLMFPLLASVQASGETARLRTYVMGTTRVVVLLLGLMTSVASATSLEVQSLLFPKEYADAASDLKYLIWGYSGYAFIVTSAWILNSTQRERLGLVLVAGLLAIVSVASTLFLGLFGHAGASMGVAIAGGLGFVLAWAALRSAFRIRLPWGTLRKIAVAIGAVETLGYTWQAQGVVMIFAKLTTLSLVYIFVVFGTRAITLAEIRGLRRG